MRSQSLFWLGCSLVSFCHASRNDITTTTTTAESSNQIKPESESDMQTSSSLHRRLTTTAESDYLEKVYKDHLHEFEPLHDVHILGPNVFPEPTEKAKKANNNNNKIVPFIKPVIGKHRPDHDAVFCYAAEYNIKNYVVFIESLRRTGFDGDIVVAVHDIDLRNDEIKEYLSSVPNVVVYAPHQVCFNFENEVVESAKGGIRTCQCHNLYAQVDATTGELTPLPDPRAQRTLANTRYEIYWIMVHNYYAQQWMLLVDARDTFFQTNPFVHVPRHTDATGESGILYFFGENMDATRIGESKMNRKWLKNAYGQYVSDALEKKPTICSGATMGEQIALETYLRAMVAEADETGTVLMGSDQGFHNRLYYSSKLTQADRIHDIVVFDQGTGIVNNMGAMRTQPLDKWGNGNIIQTTKNSTGTHYTVMNWDGTPSAVVHQFDRHKQLSDYLYKHIGGQFYKEWTDRRKKATE